MLISIILIATYILYIVYKYGIPKSISLTYYLLKHRWIFSLVLILSVVFSFNDFMTPEKWLFLSFIFLSGILFVAFAPNINNDELEDKVHTGAAIISLIASLIWIAIVKPEFLSLWIFFFLYILVKIKDKEKLSDTNYKFWAEIIMLLTLCLI